uniref:MollF n=2 Tax=Ovatospora TaxID=1934392 RepID=A0AA96Y0J3_9PEZI|nr:Aromatic prenyltransferases [Ovatospora brasiliensis]WNZ75140.1 MollF [Ovatospora sp.]
MATPTTASARPVPDTTGARDEKPNALDLQLQDTAYWNQHSTEVLASLLASSGSYTPSEIDSHIDFVQRNVIPCLGPEPARAHAPTYYLAPAPSPFEPSLNFTDASGPNPAVRFTFELLGPNGCSPSDPVAAHAATQLLPRLAAVTPGTDMRWVNAFAPALLLTDQEAADLKDKLPPWLKRVPQCAVAYDLDGGERAMKVYFYPMVKHIATGKRSEELVFDVIRRLEPLGPKFGPALDVLEDYLRGADEAAPIKVLGIDAVDPEVTKARLKVYMRRKSTAFNVVRDAVTLGGRVVDPETLKGLEVLKGIWHLLLDEPEGIADDNWNKPPNDPTNEHWGLALGIELTPGRATPQVKVYVPAWQYARSDAAMVKNMEKVFQTRNWLWGKDGRYGKMLEGAFGKHQVEMDRVLHSYISFAYTEKTGLYMTTYFAGPAEA